VRPAINVGLSVSRVGGSAQVKAMKKVAGTLRLELAQYREVEAFSQFASDLDKATQAQLARGSRLVEALKQGQYEPVAVEKQILIIFAVSNGYLDDYPVESVRKYEKEMNTFLETKYPQLLEEIRSKKELTDEIRGKIVSALDELKKQLGDFK
jgi:F-type H+-transporting ATPase subunit alpha